MSYPALGVMPFAWFSTCVQLLPAFCDMQGLFWNMLLFRLPNYRAAV